MRNFSFFNNYWFCLERLFYNNYSFFPIIIHILRKIFVGTLIDKISIRTRIGELMNLTHIEHIGIAVKNLDDAIKYYENVLGLKCYKIEEVADQKVKTAFLKIGDTKIELLESTEPDGPIGKFIEKKGEGIHHIAFSVNGLEEALKQAEEKGIKLIDDKPRKGAEGLNIAFLHPKSTHGVLTELCESPGK